MVDEGTFREDLYYRLDVLNVSLPPLRERKEDIPLLLNHFLQICAADNNKEISGFSDEALNKLSLYNWKGNVRELRNVVEKMTVLSKEGILDVKDIPSYILDGSSQRSIASPTGGDSLDIGENEKQLIIKALKETNNNCLLYTSDAADE